ncbi:MAG: GNAT family N-acetyltransferase [Bacillota bacterium]
MDIVRMETYDIKALKKLYRANHWDAYLKDMEAFKRMFENASVVYGAYEEDALIGLVRAMSDDAHILYIQDILVDPAHLRKGVGARLMETVLKRFEHVRQKILLTDKDAQGAHALYRRFGFKEVSEKGLTSFVRFD